MLKSFLKVLSRNKILTIWFVGLVFCLFKALTAPDVPLTTGSQVLVQDGSIHDDDYEVHSFRLSGEGVKVALISSARTSASEYNGLVKELNKDGYQTIVPSLSNRLKFENLSEDAKILQRILDALHDEFQLQQYCIITTGYGGEMVREIVNQNSQKLNGVVFISPFGENLMTDTNFKIISGKKADNFFYPSKAPDYWGYTLIRHSGRSISESMHVSRRTKWEVSNDIPTLALLGETDPVTSIQDLKVSFKNQSILQAEIKLIPESSFALLYEQPDLLNEYVSGFLKKHCVTDTAP